MVASVYMGALQYALSHGFAGRLTDTVAACEVLIAGHVFPRD